MSWLIEVNLNEQEWVPVRESWFTRKDKDAARPMTPRFLDECSEKAVEQRDFWFTYKEGSMRLRDTETEEIISFEVFTF